MTQKENSSDYWEGVHDAFRLISEFLEWKERNPGSKREVADYIQGALTNVNRHLSNDLKGLLELPFERGALDKRSSTVLVPEPASRHDPEPSEPVQPSSPEEISSPKEIEVPDDMKMEPIPIPPVEIPESILEEQDSGSFESHVSMENETVPDIRPEPEHAESAPTTEGPSPVVMNDDASLEPQVIPPQEFDQAQGPESPDGAGSPLQEDSEHDEPALNSTDPTKKNLEDTGSDNDPFI